MSQTQQESRSKIYILVFWLHLDILHYLPLAATLIYFIFFILIICKAWHDLLLLWSILIPGRYVVSFQTFC